MGWGYVNHLATLVIRYTHHIHTRVRAHTQIHTPPQKSQFICSGPCRLSQVLGNKDHKPDHIPNITRDPNMGTREQGVGRYGSPQSLCHISLHTHLQEALLTPEAYRGSILGRKNTLPQLHSWKKEITPNTLHDSRLKCAQSLNVGTF